MAIVYLDPGTSDTFDLSKFEFTSGVVTSESTIVHGQPRSLKIGSAYASARKFNVLSDAGFRVSFYLRVDALPTDHSEGEGVFAIHNSSGLPLINVRLDEATGVIKGFGGGGGSPLSGFAGTHALSLNTWYRVAIAATLASSLVNEWRVWVDGVADISVSNADLDRAGANRIVFGAGSGCTCYTSDAYADDSSALTDPGDIRVTVKLPTANSTNAWNTAIGASPSNRWENVDDRPLSEADGWQETAVSAAEESYGIQTAAGGDVDMSGATIIGHGAWIWAKAGTGGLGTPQLIRNGTDVPVTLTASPAYYVAYAASATYPSGVIGMKSAGVTDTTFLYETGMLIAYTPSGGPAPAGSGVAGSAGVYSPRATTQPVASGWA